MGSAYGSNTSAMRLLAPEFANPTNPWRRKELLNTLKSTADGHNLSRIICRS